MFFGDSTAAEGADEELPVLAERDPEPAERAAVHLEQVGAAMTASRELCGAGTDGFDGRLVPPLTG